MPIHIGCVIVMYWKCSNIIDKLTCELHMCVLLLVKLLALGRKRVSMTPRMAVKEIWSVNWSCCEYILDKSQELTYKKKKTL